MYIINDFIININHFISWLSIHSIFNAIISAANYVFNGLPWYSRASRCFFFIAAISRYMGEYQRTLRLKFLHKMAITVSFTTLSVINWKWTKFGSNTPSLLVFLFYFSTTEIRFYLQILHCTIQIHALINWVFDSLLPTTKLEHFKLVRSLTFYRLAYNQKKFELTS